MILVRNRPTEDHFSKVSIYNFSGLKIYEKGYIEMTEKIYLEAFEKCPGSVCFPLLTKLAPDLSRPRSCPSLKATAFYSFERCSIDPTVTSSPFFESFHTRILGSCKSFERC